MMHSHPMQEYLILVALVSTFLYLTRKKGLIFLVSCFLLLISAVYFLQDRMLYLPVIGSVSRSPAQNPPDYQHPSARGLLSADVSLNTSDGVVIRGWHVKYAEGKADRVIVYFHENAGNIGTRLQYVAELVSRTGSDVILVAYRGYSDSESQPSEAGIVRDSHAVLQYAVQYTRQHNHSQKIYILGRSLGGAVAINLAADPYHAQQIAGVILQNTFTSIDNMIEAVFGALWFLKYVSVNKWNSIDKIGSIKCPVLFIKSMRDELVPPAQMDQLIKATTAPKQVFEIAEGTHNYQWSIVPGRYFKSIKQLFKIVQQP